MKTAKIIKKFKVECPYCKNVSKVGVWAIAHTNIDLIFTCLNCKKVSKILAHTIGR